MSSEAAKPRRPMSELFVGVNIGQMVAEASQTYTAVFPTATPWDSLPFTNPLNFLRGIADVYIVAGRVEEVAVQETWVETARRRFRAKFLDRGPQLALAGLSPRPIMPHNAPNERLIERVNFARHSGKLGISYALLDTTAYIETEVVHLPNVPADQQLRAAGLLREGETVTGYGRKKVVIEDEGYALAVDGPTKVMDWMQGTDPKQTTFINFAAVTNTHTNRPAGLIFF